MTLMIAGKDINSTGTGLSRRTGCSYLRKVVVGHLFLFVLLSFSAVQASSQSAIASAHPLATDAGMEILRKGGNAFDAAVTVSAVLGVVEPYSSGFGGGGFWLLHRASDGKQVMLDGRERAPLAAHRDMYLDANGEVIPKASIDGPLAAGIPGMPAALVHLAEHYGRLPLKQTLQPAIDIARNGFEVDAYYQKMIGWRLAAIQSSMAASEIFLQGDQVPETGYRIKQPDLADTLSLLAEKGFDGFYQGKTAQKLVNSVKASGGIWSLQDLAEYRVKERQPVRVGFQGKTIVSAALPSSGGIVLAQVFNMLGTYKLDTLSRAQKTHLIVESMRRAYRDRARFLGDQDVVEVPVSKLLDPDYAKHLGSDIRLDSASRSESLPGESEGQDTTHFSVLDAQGNRVSATLSINYPFGSGFVAEGTGVLLNDEMDDFSSSPGVPNVYGLVGSDANAIAPGKRMLSSMSPTFVESNEGVAILGTPGGSRIITMVLLAILEMDKTQDPQDWVDLPRFHHQYLPDVIQYEPGALDDALAEQLQALGHKMKPLDDTYGNMHAIFVNRKTGEVKAASDKRGIGTASVASF